MKKIISLLMALFILSNWSFTSVAAQTPSCDKSYVIQIVTDGLSDKMFDQLKAKGANTPNLDSLILKGSRFRNVETTVPSYAASSAAGMTGASAQTNGCLIEYYDGSSVKTSQFNMKAETIFNKFHSDKAVNGVMAAGWRVGNKAISLFNGFPTDDINYVFKNHGTSDKVPCSIKTVTDDIIDSLNSGSIPQFMSVYSNDIISLGWTSYPTDNNLIKTLELIDKQIGRIKTAVNTAGISNNATIIVNSLANATLNNGKVTTSSMAKAITDATGVQVYEEKFIGKASIEKQYYLTYAQLYFMPSATQEDKQKVLDYLNTDGTPIGDAVEKVVTPQEVGAPNHFADYIICPVNGKSFCSTGKVFRVDDMHNNKIFCIVSGVNAPKRSSIVKSNPTILDIVPTICSILGTDVPADNEGTAWIYEDIQTQPVLTVASPENNQKVYKSEIEVIGIVDYPCDVKVNNKSVTLDGVNFSSNLTLTEGENIITVTAQNSYGTVTQQRTVNYIKPAIMPDGNRVVYINWDGFARYYLDEAIKTGRNIPTIKNIIKNEGVLFNDANTHIPSVTNSLQPAIVSGTPPLFTDNHYRYFNKEQGVVIQESPARKDEAETIAQSCVRQGLDVISINQFALEDKGTTSNDQRALYVDAGSLNGAVTRFDAAIKMIKELKAGSFTLDNVPRFIALYMDDLDGLGHNHNSLYGYPVATTEKERMNNILNRLEEMDLKLGEFIKACKDTGIYDTMSFILTTDHGMANFGQQEKGGNTYNSSLDDMIEVIEALGEGYKCEVLPAGSTPSADTDIAIVSVGLQAQLSYVGEFNSRVISQKNSAIIEAIKDEVYVDVILTPEQIQADGIKEGFADLLVSPKPPYSFKTGDYNKVRIAQGQHDSYSQKAKKITSIMWGKNIKKGINVNEKIYNTDFAATMSALMGVNVPLDSTGKVLYSALDGIENVNEYKTVKSYTKETSINAVANTKRLEIPYSSLNNGKLQLIVNGKKVRDVFFPETNSRNKKLTKIINISLQDSDTVNFVSIDNQNSEDILFNQISFFAIKRAIVDN